MKISTWNVNGIRAVHKKGYLLPYLEIEQPDVFCIQETKAEVEQLTSEIINPLGYDSCFHSCRRKKGYSGVATFSKVKPLNYFTEIGAERFDEEGRVVGADFGEFVLLNVYFPNGGSGKERLDYKLDFYSTFFEFCEKLRSEGKQLLICGDYNTAHYEIDLARPKENVNTSGFMEIERKRLDELVQRGYVDVFRQFNQEPEQYTWWDQKTRARDRNIGWRIDYHWATETLAQKARTCYIQPHVIGSDHCPVVIELDL